MEVATVYLISPALGLVIGAIELITRFRSYIRPILCFQGLLFLVTHAAMALLAFVIVINFGSLLKDGSVPAAILKEPVYVAIFCGLGYGALLRSKFLDFNSPVSKDKNIGFMTIFDGLLNFFTYRLQNIYSDAKIVKANELLSGKNILNLPNHIRANLPGFSGPSQSAKDEILKEIDAFEKAIKSGKNAEIVIYGLIHKVVDHIGMRSLENFINTMK
jgi:hypothetical protein